MYYAINIVHIRNNCCTSLNNFFVHNGIYRHIHRFIFFCPLFCIKSRTICSERIYELAPIPREFSAPAADAKPFVKIGDRVKKGQVLAIVEAMKMMNEIESDCDGTISEILVTNGAPVEYGQPLFRIS